MKFILFTDKKKLDSILENGIQVNDCYRGKGILVYPEIDIQFRAPNSESEFINEEKEVNKISILTLKIFFSVLIINSHKNSLL